MTEVIRAGARSGRETELPRGTTGSKHHGSNGAPTPPRSRRPRARHEPRFRRRTTLPRRPDRSAGAEWSSAYGAYRDTGTLMPHRRAAGRVDLVPWNKEHNRDGRRRLSPACGGRHPGVCRGRRANKDGRWSTRGHGAGSGRTGGASGTDGRDARVVDAMRRRVRKDRIGFCVLNVRTRRTFSATSQVERPPALPLGRLHGPYVSHGLPLRRFQRMIPEQTAMSVPGTKPSTVSLHPRHPRRVAARLPCGSTLFMSLPKRSPGRVRWIVGAVPVRWRAVGPLTRGSVDGQIRSHTIDA